eukprot:TRINITY_DN827_c0_g2_i2.p1 TRINITY_DN827_c0_g2~~TRINITY_DN827_c0_g2_i2.p1  ORF type:complete len:119 (+),score=17.66 TRINITY_DN827_c0_g2_i2:128-484(+)
MRAELAWFAPNFVSAVRLVARDNVVARLDGGHTRSDGLNDASGLVSEDGGEESFGVVPSERVGIGVTEGGVQNLHPDLLRLWWSCLLYTSDAADEEDSVDLGGRRIIKKKKIKRKVEL